MTQPARHSARDRLLFQRPSAGVRCGKSMTASLPLPDDSPPRIPTQQPSDHPATGSNGAHKRSQIPPHTSQTPHSENRWEASTRTQLTPEIEPVPEVVSAESYGRQWFNSKADGGADASVLWLVIEESVDNGIDPDKTPRIHRAPFEAKGRQ